MSLRRFFLNSPPTSSRALLDGAEAHHLIHVLRAEPGSFVELIDGSGRIWKGAVAQIHRDEVELTGVVLMKEESSPSGRVILVQSLCKADKLEWLLQKTTELGVAEVYLLEAERSVVRIPPDRVEDKMDRWRKIMMGAAKQSRRSVLPILHLPTSCQAVCESVLCDLKVLLSENEREVKLKTLLRTSDWKSVACCIGPEGGWTPGEERMLALNQFRSAGLGRNILRTETAAIAVMAVLMYELSDAENRF